MLPWRERVLFWQTNMLSSKRNIYRLTIGSVLLPKVLCSAADHADDKLRFRFFDYLTKLVGHMEA